MTQTKGPYWWTDKVMPYKLAFTPDESSWRKVMRYLEIDEPWPMLTRQGGNVMTFENMDGTSDLVCVLSIRSDKPRDIAQLVGIIAHKAVHVLQCVMRSVEASDVAARHDEYEAYFIQFVTSAVYEAYTQWNSGQPTSKIILPGPHNGKKPVRRVAQGTIQPHVVDAGKD